MLIPDEAGGSRGAPPYRARIDPDLTFTIEAVPPGRYLAVASTRGVRDTEPLFGRQSITVSGTDIEGLVLTLTPGATVTGVVRFDGSAPAESGRSVSVGLMTFDQSITGTESLMSAAHPVP